MSAVCTYSTVKWISADILKPTIVYCIYSMYVQYMYDMYVRMPILLCVEVGISHILGKMDTHSTKSEMKGKNPKNGTFNFNC